MERSFLQQYLEAFPTIEGWFQFDAALLFMAYHQLLAQHVPPGRVLEIGVHHGLSTIAVAALRGEGQPLTAVDLFEKLQNQNVSGSGSGSRRIFEQNMRRFYPDTKFVSAIARASRDLTPQDLGSGYTFCHIDGGHSRQETYSDLRLCHAVSAPGGLIALDDYFNPEFPGVGEGAVEFMLREEQALRPVAIGYNKVLFQKLPATLNLNAEFARAFPQVPRRTASMWDQPVALFPQPLRHYLDLQASTPRHLVALGSVGPRAVFRPEAATVRAKEGQHLLLPVTVTNTSGSAFPAGEKVFGLSYHLLSATGNTLAHDGARAWLTQPLQPGEQKTLELPVEAPAAKGQYQIELDLVWEQVMWFKDVANPTAIVTLSVS